MATGMFEAAQRNAEGATCPSCESTNISMDETLGFSLSCQDCGTVLENNWEWNDTHAKGASGELESSGNIFSKSRQIGSQLASIGEDISLASMESSRERTLRKFKDNIINISTQLPNYNKYSLNNNIINYSLNIYKILIDNNYTNGIKKEIIECVCLYISCRHYKLPYLLIDFSKVVKINIFVLAKNFDKICRLVPIKLDINCDIKMYVDRYVNELDFGDKNEKVVKYANKIVNSMKSNGITQGRRIAGICGAAIFIAGKLCGFKMTTKEIVKVCQLSELTIQERLKEFLNSKASKMTLNEFKDENYKKNPKWKHNNMPPSFIKNIQLKKEKKEEINNNNDNEYKNNNNNNNNVNNRNNNNGNHSSDEFDPFQINDNNDNDINNNKNNPKNIIKKINNDSGNISDDYDDFSDDSEVNDMILNKDEIKVKETIWHYNLPIDEYDEMMRKQIQNKTEKMEKQEKRKKEELLDEKFLFQKVSNRIRKHFGDSNKIDSKKLNEIYNENKDINNDNNNNNNDKNENNSDNDNDNDANHEDSDDEFDPFKDIAEPPKKKRKI